MKPVLTDAVLEDASTRVVNFVRWHCDNLNAPAPLAAIEAMLADKFEADPGWTSIKRGAGVLVANLVKRGELRFVSHDYLIDGYATVEDPS